jgi:hypothetical protein
LFFEPPRRTSSSRYSLNAYSYKIDLMNYLIASTLFTIAIFMPLLAQSESLEEKIRKRGITIPQLIKSGSFRLCELGQTKIYKKLLSKKELDKIRDFIVAELKAGPEKIKTGKKVGQLFDGIYIGADKESPAGCFVHAVNLLSEDYDFFELLLDKKILADKALWGFHGIILEYVQKDSNRISSLVKIVQGTDEVARRFVHLLPTQLGRIAFHYSVDGALKELESIDPKKANYEQFKKYWSNSLDYIRYVSLVGGYPNKFTPILLNKNFPEDEKFNTKNAIKKEFPPEKLPPEVAKWVQEESEHPAVKKERLKREEKARKIKLAKELEKKLIANLVSRSWIWTSSKSVTKQDIQNYNKLIATIKNRKKDYFFDKSRDKPYFDYFVPFEIKFVLDNPHFPLKLKKKFFNFLVNVRTLRQISPLDKGVKTNFYLMRKTRCTDCINSSLHDKKLEDKISEEMPFVSIKSYIDVFRLSLKKIEEYDKRQGGTGWTMRFVDLIKLFREEPQSKDIGRAYLKYFAKKKKTLFDYSIAFTHIGPKKYQKKLSQLFKCDQMSYLATLYIVEPTPQLTHFKKLLSCPLNFFNKRQLWRQAIPNEALAAQIDREKDLEKRQLFLEVYEKQKKVPLIEYSTLGNEPKVRKILKEEKVFQARLNHALQTTARSSNGELIISRIEYPDETVRSGLPYVPPPFHGNWVGVTKVLLEHGADPHAKNSKGQSAIDLATDPELRVILKAGREKLSSDSSQDKSDNKSSFEADVKLLKEHFKKRKKLSADAERPYHLTDGRKFTGEESDKERKFLDKKYANDIRWKCLGFASVPFDIDSGSIQLLEIIGRLNTPEVDYKDGKGIKYVKKDYKVRLIRRVKDPVLLSEWTLQELKKQPPRKARDIFTFSIRKRLDQDWPEKGDLRYFIQFGYFPYDQDNVGAKLDCMPEKSSTMGNWFEEQSQQFKQFVKNFSEAENKKCLKYKGKWNQKTFTCNIQQTSDFWSSVLENKKGECARVGGRYMFMSTSLVPDLMCDPYTEKFGTMYLSGGFFGRQSRYYAKTCLCPLNKCMLSNQNVKGDNQLKRTCIDIPPWHFEFRQLSIAVLNHFKSFSQKEIIENYPVGWRKWFNWF